jgi:hypothetical protein
LDTARGVWKLQAERSAVTPESDTPLGAQRYCTPPSVKEYIPEEPAASAVVAAVEKLMYPTYAY